MRAQGGIATLNSDGTHVLMKHTILALILITSSALMASVKQPVDWVDPTIETNKGRWFFCTPGSRPFGMVAAAPHTVNKNQKGGGYVYSENDIKGFTQIHGWMMGGLNLMPTTGGVDPTLYEQWNSPFSHDSEVIKPGYQKVFLDRYNTWVELTSTDRVALYRYTFSEDAAADILMVLGGRVGNVTMAGANAKKINDRTVEGEFSTILRQWGGPGDVKVFFVIEFSQPFAGLDGWLKQTRLTAIDELKAEPVSEAERFITSRGEIRKRWSDPKYHAGMSARYDAKAGDALVVKIGISYTSLENARNNLRTECPHWDFDRVVQESRDEWNDWLGKVAVKGGSDALKTKFYTDLWHVLLGRHKIDDVSGDYPDRTTILREHRASRFLTEFKVKTLPKGGDGKPLHHMYNSDSWWHSFWNLNILWGLGWPEVMDGMSASMMQYAKNHIANGHQGILPRGPCGGGFSGIMTGCSAVPLIASTYQKGLLKKAAAEDALGLMKRNFTKQEFPVEKAGVSTLYSYEVWTMAQMAKDLSDQDTYDFFEQRSHLWTSLYRPEYQLLFSRKADGSWMTDEPKAKRGAGWDESNSWVGTWSVAHDLPLLAALMGGPVEAAQKLNIGFEDSALENFTGSYGTRSVNFGNETGHCNAHVFNYFAHPWLSQYWVRQVSIKTFGGTDPDHGYGGHDEDQGKTGAISALMKLGLYSVRGTAASEPIYEITTPEFEEVTIQLDPNYYSGREFTIKCYDQQPENVYIQSAKLNGEPLQNCWFTHKEFAQGGLLELWLGHEPNKAWGKGPVAESPYDAKAVQAILKRNAEVAGGTAVPAAKAVVNASAAGAKNGIAPPPREAKAASPARPNIL
jgi:predicted alpha-1,2-mannosidase